MTLISCYVCTIKCKKMSVWLSAYQTSLNLLIQFAFYYASPNVCIICLWAFKRSARETVKSWSSVSVKYFEAIFSFWIYLNASEVTINDGDKEEEEESTSNSSDLVISYSHIYPKRLESMSMRFFTLLFSFLLSLSHFSLFSSNYYFTRDIIILYTQKRIRVSA